MSWEATAWAADQVAAPDVTDGEGLLLLFLANEADETGYAIPGVGYLGRRLGRSDRTIRERVRALEDKGLLARERRRRSNGSMTSNGYQLAMPPPARAPEAVRPQPKDLVVYAIGGGARVKFGITANLEARLAGLQTSSPHDLAVLAAVPGTREDEAQLHERLRHHRAHGEWFDDCEQVQAVVAEMQATTGTPAAIGDTGAGGSAKPPQTTTGTPLAIGDTGTGPPVPSTRSRTTTESSNGKETETSKSGSNPRAGGGGWTEWLTDYRAVTGNARVRGSKAAEAAYWARREDGYTQDDLHLATRGAWGDDYIREHGHAVPDTILRPSKVDRYIALGQQAAQAGKATAKPAAAPVPTASKAAAEKIWAEASKALRAELPDSTWHLWFDKIQAVGEDEGVLYLAAPASVRAWVERRYAKPVAAAVGMQIEWVEA